MKSFNHITFKGCIGGNARISTVSNRRVANFSVATEFVYKASDGNWAVETTWLSVCAWQSNGICDLDLLHKGAKVSGSGRMRSRKYTDQQGNEREILEVLADSLDIIYEKPKDSAETPKAPSYTTQTPQNNTTLDPDGDLPF